MTRSLDPKCPDSRRKEITIEVGDLLCRCCYLVSSYAGMQFFFHLDCFIFIFCHYLYCCWNLICIVIVQWFIAMFFYLYTACFHKYPLYMLRESPNKGGTAVGRMQNLPSRGTYGIRDAWRNTSQWRPIGLRSVEVNSVQNRCFAHGCWVPSQCKTHPLDIKVSVKTSFICSSHIPNGGPIFALYGHDSKNISVYISRNMACPLNAVIIRFLACAYSYCSLG